MRALPGCADYGGAESVAAGGRDIGGGESPGVLAEVNTF